jgi:hypothetical protein
MSAPAHGPEKGSGKTPEGTVIVGTLKAVAETLDPEALVLMDTNIYSDVGVKPVAEGVPKTIEQIAKAATSLGHHGPQGSGGGGGHGGGGHH